MVKEFLETYFVISIGVFNICICLFYSIKDYNFYRENNWDWKLTPPWLYQPGNHSTLGHKIAKGWARFFLWGFGFIIGVIMTLSGISALMS